MTAAPALDSNHLDTLEIAGSPSLTLDVYQDPALATDCSHLVPKLAPVWERFLAEANSEGILERLGLNPQSALEIEVTFIGNELMQRLNREYRGKDKPTDVLTFTLLADAEDPRLWLALPVVQLGSIFLCVDWAESFAEEGKAERFLLERFIHGLLHLSGQHHDTMDEYHRVVGIQNRVLEGL